MTVRTYPDSDAGSVLIRFTIADRVEQGVVSVVGSFNDWTPGVDPFVLQPGGVRTPDVIIPLGHDVYFRYLASDGAWFDEPDADEITEHGSVLYLSSSPTPATPDPAPSELTPGDVPAGDTAAGDPGPAAA